MPGLILPVPKGYRDELGDLAEWVNGSVVPVYVATRVPSFQTPWCATWWERPEAVGRLHAIWLAYQAMSDTAEADATAPHEWHRDHLDPAMGQLRAPDRPFAGCMTKPGQISHNPSPGVSVVEYTGA